MLTTVKAATTSGGSVRSSSTTLPSGSICPACTFCVNCVREAVQNRCTNSSAGLPTAARRRARSVAASNFTRST